MGKKSGKIGNSRLYQQQTVTDQQIEGGSFLTGNAFYYFDRQEECFHLNADRFDDVFQMIRRKHDGSLQAGIELMDRMMQESKTVGIKSDGKDEVYLDAGLFQQMASRGYNARSITNEGYVPGAGEKYGCKLWGHLASTIANDYEPGEDVKAECCLDFTLPAECVSNKPSEVPHDLHLHYSQELHKMLVRHHEPGDVSYKEAHIRDSLSLPDGKFHDFVQTRDGFGRMKVGEKETGYYYDLALEQMRFPDIPGVGTIACQVPNIHWMSEDWKQSIHINYRQGLKDMDQFGKYAEHGVLALEYNAFGSVGQQPKVFPDVREVVLGKKIPQGHLCLPASEFMKVANWAYQNKKEDPPDINRIGASIQDAYLRGDGDAVVKDGMGHDMAVPRSAFWFEDTFSDMVKRREGMSMAKAEEQTGVQYG